MDGVLVVDKPQGLTSHDVVAVARRCLREPRIGHTGTLDPLATGVLPLACGRATRLVRFFTASDKEYDAGIRFGLTTDSYDITGVETSRSGQAPSREAIEEALQSLRGEYLQTPPAYSAKKVSGRRAYEMARRAEPVALEPVPVRVTRAELLDVSGASARVVVACSAGFYVRTFAHSLGERVGTGACLESLRRTRSGDFDLATAVPLEVLQRDAAAAVGRVVALNQLLPNLPAARLTDEGRTRVLHGRDVDEAHLCRDDERGLDNGRTEWVRLLDEAGHLLALGTPAAGKTGDRRALHPAVVLI
jgi:tRNA pseudouridine55 synthase